MYFLAIPCNIPTNGAQTVDVDTSISYVFGDNYTYVCNEGYEHSGELVSTCQSDGNWSLSPPTCTGNLYPLHWPFLCIIYSLNWKVAIHSDSRQKQLVR